LEDAVLDFLDAELDIFVHCGGDVGDGFAAGGLVVVIAVAPDGLAEFLVQKLHVEIEAGDNAAGADFAEGVEVSCQAEINAAFTAKRRNRLEMAGLAKSASQGILEEFHGRLGPAMILVQAKLLALSTVHNAIFPVDVRGLEGADKESSVNWRLRAGERRSGRMGELVILHGLDTATSGESGGEERNNGEGSASFPRTPAGRRDDVF